jgi:hypothetical protein
MAYTPEKIEECFDWIISEIESGKSLISTLNTNGMPSPTTFYKWIDESDQYGIITLEAKEKMERYARACEVRELLIFDDILKIADKQDKDVEEVEGIVIVNHNVINRSRLQIDARKWILSKMNPKKYGDRETKVIEGGEKPIKIDFTD